MADTMLNVVILCYGVAVMSTKLTENGCVTHCG